VRAVSAFAGFKLELRPRPTDRSDPDPDPDLAPASVLDAGLGRSPSGDAVELGGHRAVPTPAAAGSRADHRRRRWPIRRVTLLVPGFTRLLGAIYLLTGILGFALGGFGAKGVTTLVIFDLNPVHSGVHTIVGAAMIASTLLGDDLPRIVLTLAGGTYLAIGVVGLFLLGGGALGGGINVLALNQADNVLHVLTGGLAVYVGLTGEGPDDAIVWNR
jgi:hypothetical protein